MTVATDDRRGDQGHDERDVGVPTTPSALARSGSGTPGEIAEAVTDRRKQRERDRDQRLMPFTRRPSSRVTSRSAVRRARS